MRSASTTYLLAALVIFGAAFGATTLLFNRGSGEVPPPRTAAPVPREPRSEATVPPPSAREQEAQPATTVTDDGGVPEGERGLEPVSDAARREAALERARATEGSGATSRTEDPVASEKGLAVGEQVGSHSNPRYAGTGTYRVVSSDRPTVGRGGRTVAYSIEVEDGLRIDGRAFADTVTRILSDERSWIGSGRVRLRQVAAPASADFNIRLSSPSKTDALCAPMTTEGIYSCRNGRNVVVNYYRWTAGAYAYPNALESYRTYVVNHEFGHALGHDHRPCAGSGAPAPVMLQQSISLRGCQAREWPSASELAATG